jgi:hypothetical protein
LLAKDKGAAADETKMWGHLTTWRDLLTFDPPSLPGFRLPLVRNLPDDESGILTISGLVKGLSHFKTTYTISLSA